MKSRNFGNFEAIFRNIYSQECVLIIKNPDELTLKELNIKWRVK